MNVTFKPQSDWCAPRLFKVAKENLPMNAQERFRVFDEPSGKVSIQMRLTNSYAMSTMTPMEARALAACLHSIADHIEGA